MTKESLDNPKAGPAAAKVENTGPREANNGLSSPSYDTADRDHVDGALRGSEERLRLALEIGGLASWDWHIASGKVVWNDRHFLQQGYAVGEVLPSYQAWLDRLHPDDRDETVALIEAARDGRSTFHHEFRALWPDGSIHWRAARGRFFYDESGAPVRMIGVAEDITEQKLAVQRMAASEARLRLALEAGRMAPFEWSLDDALPPLSDDLRRRVDFGDAGARLEEGRTRHHPDDAALLNKTRQRALDGDDTFADFEFRRLTADAQVRWLQVRSEIVRDNLGRPRKLVGVQLDVTEQRENEERLRLLMLEVDHRAKNLLFVVQSMVSLAKAGDLETYRQALLGRIESLSRAHQLLAESRWSGGDLRQLLTEELGPYGLGDNGHIKLDGPPISLPARHAQALALCLHELATNAAKYGALSVDEGVLTVRWRSSHGQLELSWIERGGAPVVAPKRSGFGGTLLKRSLQPFGGRVELHWAELGLSAQITLPLQANPDPEPDPA
ncbi:sensor histidine kinase [Caulobacter sp. FWC26]|jgi:PAS domain S-box-containing protein|uniref:sensor histidine kinase n=1 Tax=Caulobacter sp. FWC26 TaxID=69665 RepID=UPI000C14B6DB|nr:PAS domain-containing protein [Caulobacter sp. FWC26]AZS21567.1 PAS domain S-box protein [Caulobacter sp. FWC26]